MKKIFLLPLFFIAVSVAAQTPPEDPRQDRIEELEQRTERLEKRSERWDRVASRFENFTVSGYIQAQYQWGQRDASLRVGSSNEDSDGSFNRIGIRRGRIKLDYAEGIFSSVFQLDITEKGVGVKDAYLNIKDPWLGVISLRAGIFDRPFGYETAYSSSSRKPRSAPWFSRPYFPTGATSVPCSRCRRPNPRRGAS